MVNNWLNIIQDYLLPPTCVLCGHPGSASQDLCRFCLDALPKNRFSCYRCAEAFEFKTVFPSICGNCQTAPPAFDKTQAPFLYQDAMRHLIRTLKFNAHYKNARVLGTLLAESVGRSGEMPDCIIPVPLHSARYRERGFNQSVEIARRVSKILDVPLNLSACRRHRPTLHQAGLPAEQRRKNLRNAFSVVKPMKVRHVAIVDDVMTTGSTVNELAKALKKAGADRIDVWVCARA